MMYVNTKTGARVSSDCEITGDNWKEEKTAKEPKAGTKKKSSAKEPKVGTKEEGTTGTPEANTEKEKAKENG